MTSGRGQARRSIRDAYDEWSATYDADRNLTRDLDEQIMRRVLPALRFRSVLEIGCGTGKNTALLAEIARRVHAIDFSEGMIRRARGNVRKDNVTFTIADITHPWPCRDGSVDLVTCNLVLEHVADLGHVFREAARVLTVGGRLFICELHPFRQYQGKQAEFTCDGQTTLIPAFLHHLSDFFGAGAECGFALESLEEMWHDQDDRRRSPPRVLALMFGETSWQA